MVPPPTLNRLVIACCGMELCWLGAWANFLMGSSAQIPFPLARAGGAFVMALFLASFFRMKYYRRIWVLLGHFAAAGLMIGVAAYPGSEWSAPGSAFHWYQKSLMAFLVGFFWYRGARLSVRPLSHISLCHQFDMGISLLFALVLIKLLLERQMGITLPETLTVYGISGYFFFGLTAIFLSRNPPVQEKAFLEGFRVYGILLGGGMALTISGLALVFIFLPWMTSFADSGYQVLKQVALPLSPYLIAFLKYILSPPNPSGNAGSPADPPLLTESVTRLGQDQAEWVMPFVITPLLGLLFLLFAGMICYFGYRIFQWLMLKNSLESPPPAWLFSGMFHRLVVWFNGVKASVLCLAGKMDTAEKGFVRLVSWGRKSRMPRLQNQTPSEYASQLVQAFRPLENEIRTIVQGFQGEAYGEVPLDQTQLAQMAAALKKLHSPLFWGLRLKIFWKTFWI